ncbi:outer membrane protein assembly factor BamA [Lyticum sinuosum]|uniref:Outer membrane protein assembly factor BamA n=1 Tax=Lyticum sinuosum TaxID=1332059 RepID=A0AAE5AHD3_9RICK|nr:outer membrane protein assembly factor BamA [Lyticum sinuosum]MDZ5760983.1 Outer membrane protein assembly factor BamA precursor [Lyticum sinuosum]
MLRFICFLTLFCGLLSFNFISDSDSLLAMQNNIPSNKKNSLLNKQKKSPNEIKKINVKKIQSNNIPSNKKNNLLNKQKKSPNEIKKINVKKIQSNNIINKNDDKQTSNKIIKNIEVIGDSIWPKESVISISKISIGNYYTDDVTNNAIQKLYSTGHYNRINILFLDGIVKIELIENPVLAQVSIEGNNEIISRVIYETIKSKPLDTYKKDIVLQDAVTISNLYKSRGYLMTNVTPKIIKLDKNRVNLIFVVNESPKMKINSIQFVGNNAFSSSKLKDIIISRQYAWYILSPVDFFDQARLEGDKIMLRNFYMKNGYIDFKITNIVTEISPDQNGSVITFILDEGKHYDCGSISVNSEIKNIDLLPLENIISDYKFKLNKSKNSNFNEDDIENLKEKIKKEVENQGYAFVNIDRINKKDKNDNVLNTEFIVLNQTPYYINRINIDGNVRTKDEVIRREIRLSEGDPFSREILDYSKMRIDNLDYFSEVKLKVSQASSKNSYLINLNDINYKNDDILSYNLDKNIEINSFSDKNVENIKNKNDDYLKDKVDIDITVQEKGTGTAGINMGYSVKDGLTFGISTRERNIIGTGKEIGVELQCGPRSRIIGFNITDPYFMNKNMILGFDISTSSYKNFVGGTDNDDNYIYNLNFDDNNISRKNYIIDKNSSGINIGYHLNDKLLHRVGYSISLDHIQKSDSQLSPFITSQPDKTLSSVIHNTLIYNTIDNNANPKKGYKISISQSISGIGGNNKYIRNTISGSYHLSIDSNQKFVFSLSAKAGVIHGYDNNSIRIDDSYMMGMYDICGFSVTGIGPRDKNTGDALGAKKYYSGRADITFPIGLPKEIDIKGALFIEAGDSHGIDIPKNSVGLSKSMVFDDKYLRTSIGFGFIWESPLGKIGIDFGKVIRSKNYDQKDNPRISFGYGIY